MSARRKGCKASSSSDRRYFRASTSEDHGGLDDLWKQAFPFDQTWGQPCLFSEYNWNFSHLQDAFKEGGLLHAEEKVFVFSDTQIEVIDFTSFELTYVPVVVVIVSPFPPSDKVGIVSLETNREEVIDMENLNMDWVPYIPRGERASSLEISLPEISIMSRVQRKAVSEHLEFDLSSHHCVPYFHDPYKVDETVEYTVVDIVYPAEAGTIVYEFDSSINTPEGLTRRLFDAGKLSEDEKYTFMGFVKEKVKEKKRADLEAIQKQKEALEELRRTDEKVAAFENMKFYKFYPVVTPDTPDFSRYKSTYINYYYGHAHQIF